MESASRKLAEKITLLGGIAAVSIILVFGIRGQLGNMISEGVVPGDPATAALALSGETISPYDPKTMWLASVTRYEGVDREMAGNLAGELLRTIEMSPHDFRWWVERGKALERAGRTEEAERHLQRAVELAPRYSSPRWHLGNFYLRSARLDKSLEHFAVAARADAQYREEILALIDDFFGNPQVEFAKIVGDDPDLLVTLSKYHAVRGRFTESLSAWNRLSALDKKRLEIFGMEIVQITYDRKGFLTASKILRDLGRETVTPGRLEDGGFEQNFRDAGEVFFGWRFSTRDRVDVRADGRSSREGKRSLRISFDGTVQEFLGNASQILVVQPGSRYRLSYWLRGEGIRSAGLPRIQVIDLGANESLVNGPAVKGSFDWTRQVLEFKVPSGVEGVLLTLNRESCGADCPIYGLLWLDGLAVEEIK